MKRKIESIVLLIIIIIIIGVISLIMFKEKEPKLKSVTTNSNKFLSMMLEQEDGSYKEVSDTTWPQIGYTFNAKKSKCEQGSKINYIEETKQIQVFASKSDKCYVYFDKELTIDKLLAEANKDGKYTLYHHNAEDLTDKSMQNSEKIADDDSYRYSGSSEDVHNYVCFGSACSNEATDPNYKNLYRIIGLFKNTSGQYEMKIIKADAATKEDLGEGTYPESAYYGNYTYSKTNYKGKLTTFASYYWNNYDSKHVTSADNTNVNMWKISNLNTKNLNEKYYNSIKEPYKSMVVEHEWQVGGYSNSSVDAKKMYDQELGDQKLTSASINCYTQGNPTATRACSEANDLTYIAHVGLIYMSDYMYGTIPQYWNIIADNYTQDTVKNNNWLYLGIVEWTISRTSTEGKYVRYVNYLGYAGSNGYVYGNGGVRPVLYLSSDVKITGGSGTETNPYQIKID